jgi:hypothetical protein
MDYENSAYKYMYGETDYDESKNLLKKKQRVNLPFWLLLNKISIQEAVK